MQKAVERFFRFGSGKFVKRKLQIILKDGRQIRSLPGQQLKTGFLIGLQFHQAFQFPGEFLFASRIPEERFQFRFPLLRFR